MHYALNLFINSMSFGQLDTKLIFLKINRRLISYRQRRNLASLRKKPAASELNIWHLIPYELLFCYFVRRFLDPERSNGSLSSLLPNN